MLAKIGPGCIVTLDDFERGIVYEATDSGVKLINVAGHRIAASKTIVTAVEFPAFAPPYKLGEPETATLEAAVEMSGKGYGWHRRETPEGGWLPMFGMASRLELLQYCCELRSPGGNVYKIEG
jgi:hypothetical protein